MKEVRDAPEAWQYRFRPRGASAYYWTTWAPGRRPTPDATDDQIEFEERPLYSASTVEALLSRVAELEKALKPFARVAEMEERADPCASVMVNVDRCRDARAALQENIDGN